MRLERDRQRRPALRARHQQRSAYDRAVAEVDTIEIAHRNHRASGNRGRGRGVADNGKAMLHFRIL